VRTAYFGIRICGCGQILSSISSSRHINPLRLVQARIIGEQMDLVRLKAMDSKPNTWVRLPRSPIGVRMTTEYFLDGCMVKAGEIKIVGELRSNIGRLKLRKKL